MDKKKSIEQLEELKAMSETPGGKYLIKTAKETTVNAVHALMNSYAEKSHIELIATCAAIKSNFDMFMLLTGTKDQIEAIKALFEENSEK